MISEYVTHLENRDVYPGTDRPYSIYDISEPFRAKVIERINNDGYTINETDGTVNPKEVR